MLEISIHRNSKKVFDYKKTKTRSLLSMAPLLVPVNSKLLGDLFEEYKVVEVPTQIEVVEKINTLSEFEKWDISQTGQYNEWLSSNDLTEFKTLSPLGEGVNTEYFKEVENLIPQHVQEEKINMLEKTIKGLEEKTESIAKACETFNKIIQDITWIIQNPLHAILIVLEWLTPMVVSVSVIIIIIGLTAKLLGSERILKANTKDMIVNPIIFLFIYLILITALRCVVH